jgi:hypothetical protein
MNELKALAIRPVAYDVEVPCDKPQVVIRTILRYFRRPNHGGDPILRTSWTEDSFEVDDPWIRRVWSSSFETLTPEGTVEEYAGKVIFEARGTTPHDAEHSVELLLRKALAWAEQHPGI